MARYRLFTIVACLAIGGCGGGGSPTSPPPPPPAPPAQPPPPPPPEIVFAQVEDAGLDRPYRLETDGLTAAERLSGGIAAGDIDGDGDVDLYVVGGDLDPNSLYENQGDGTFLDTTEEATPVITHKGSGPAFGDIDGDGDLDLFLGAVDGSGYYMLENRDGAFFDETSGSGIELTASHTVSATFFDYDSDGHLDLFLAHWGVSRESGDDTETVWRNRGDGTFGSAGIDTGIAAHIIEGDTDTTFTLNLGDIDGDGDGDLLMTADRGRSQVFLNNGDGSFARTTDPDVIVDQAGSGAVLADYDNDGDLDWFVSSNYSLDITDGDRIGNRLYRNTGAGEFEDATDAANVADGGWGWGTCAADFDNDGNLDIFQVNGWGEELGKDFGDDPVRLFYSQGDGTFEERAADFGLDDAGQGRGVACFDAERDGDIDIVLTNASADHIVYYRNDTDNDHHYLGVKVKALGGNTFGVGALVEARTSDGVQIRTVGGGNNYASHDPLEAHFGLGDATTADIRVVWPDGEVSRENDVAADQIVTLEQPLPRLRLGVRQGRGTGFYTEGDAVEIEALQPISGYYFSHWSSSGGGAFQDAFSTSTTFVMPADSVTITANYVPGVPPDEDFSVARRWNEALLQSIRNDFARPVVHARNLFHVSAAMYDVWAAYGDLAVPWLLGRARAGETCAFDAAALAVPDDPEALRTAREEAMSFAAYRLIAHRFTRAPVSGNRRITRDIDALMGYLARRLDFDADNDSADYGSGSPGALGNHVAECYIDFGMADGANEAADYANTAYMPLNPPLEPHLPGNPDIVDLNRWQPLSLREFIDQSGNAVTGTIEHLGPEWGQVVPFALSETDLMRYQRPGETFDYWVYHDPGPPPTIDGSLSDNYKWNHALVAIWSSHLDPDGADGAECEEGSTESGCRGAQRIDISPASLGNIGTESYPTAFEDYPAFYKDEGGDPGTGYDVNPATGRTLRAANGAAGGLRPGAGGVLGRRSRLRDTARTLVRHSERGQRSPPARTPIRGQRARTHGAGMGHQGLFHDGRRHARRGHRGLGHQGMVRLHPADFGDQGDGGPGAEQRPEPGLLRHRRHSALRWVCRTRGSGRRPRGRRRRTRRQDQAAGLARAGLHRRSPGGRGRRRLDPCGELVAVSAAQLRHAAFRGLRLGTLDLFPNGRGITDPADGRRLLSRRHEQLRNRRQPVPGVRRGAERGHGPAVGDVPGRLRPDQPVAHLGRHSSARRRHSRPPDRPKTRSRRVRSGVGLLQRDGGALTIAGPPAAQETSCNIEIPAPGQ